MFFNKYVGKKLPSGESTLRKQYVNDLYGEVLENIRTQIGSNNIYVSIDETTDKKGRYICNVIIGALHKNAVGYLLSVEVIEKVNATNIVTVFEDALKILWPEHIYKESVLLFVTDAARYMKKCGGALRVLYPKLIHVTCVAHVMHRICEQIRSTYPEVDTLISNVKKIFLKRPRRVSYLKEMYPYIALPPQPVLTRWGTWLSAVTYYANYLAEIKNVVDGLSKEAACIIFAKELLAKPLLPVQLAYTQSNFSFLVEPNEGFFTKLLQTGQPIGVVLDVLSFVERNLKDARGPIAETILKKFEKVLSDNEGLEDIKVVAAIVTGSTSVIMPENICVNDVESLNWAPLVSCEVERKIDALR